jgi:hypothetical protein
MTSFNLPLSGNVTQSIFPITINMGESSDPAVEKDALGIASYGKQLGRVEDVLLILLKHVDLAKLSAHEVHAVQDFKAMMHEIANVKEKYGAKLVLRP